MLKRDIVKKTKEICKDFGIVDNPIDIVKLCNEMGLKVYEEYLPADVSGFIIVQKDTIQKYSANKVIVVNLLDIPRRRRFTIAHELAHFCLHHQESEDLYAHRDAGQNDELEREANFFASNILMPESLVVQELNELDDSTWGEAPDFVKINHIAEKFAVSNAAAQVRLSQLAVL